MLLAEALLRRKELKEKVDQIRPIKIPELYKFKMDRVKVSDGYDDIKANVPKCTLATVTAEYDYYASKLRLIDAAIQQLNWTTNIPVDDRVWVDYLESPAGRAMQIAIDTENQKK